MVTRMIDLAKTPRISVPISEDPPTIIQEPPGNVMKRTNHMLRHLIPTLEEETVDSDGSSLKVEAIPDSGKGKQPGETEPKTEEPVAKEQDETEAEVKEEESDDIVKADEKDEDEKTDSVSLDLPADQSDFQVADAPVESESAETVPPGGEGADQPEDEGEKPE